MADRVEEVMQEMVPVLTDLRRKRIFDDEELRQIVKRRRNFEYLLQRPMSGPEDYLKSVRYEVALECLRKKRSEELKWRKKTQSDFAGVERIHTIFQRACTRFKADRKLWYQRIDFCLRVGSTTSLGKVLAKAVKLHPKEEGFWLLAADRELKFGHIEAARTLLMRAIRCSPRSMKLWLEFLRLEMQVAKRVLRRQQRETAASNGAGAPSTANTSKDASAGDEEQRKNPYQPALLIFRRAITRLDKKPADCAKFLQQADAMVHDDAAVDFQEEIAALAEEVERAITARRPGCSELSAYQDPESTVAALLWRLWWTRQLAAGVSWAAIVEIVCQSGSTAIIPSLVGSLLEGISRAAAQENVADKRAGMEALLQLGASSRAASDHAAAVAVLEAFEECKDKAPPKALAKALLERSRSFMQMAMSQQPKNQQLQQLQTFLVPSGQDQVAAGKGTEAEPLAMEVSLESVFRKAPAGSDWGWLVSSFLAEELATRSKSASDLCDVVLKVTRGFWEIPNLHKEALIAVVNLELHAHFLGASAETPAWAVSSEKLCAHFEDLLRQIPDTDQEKVHWWARYIEFANKLALHPQWATAPSVANLQLRAMRSVPDQAVLADRVRMLTGMTLV